jgi:hypothetical protein
VSHHPHSSEVWLHIADDGMDRQAAPLQGQHIVDGDLDLLLNLNETFLSSSV